MYKVSSDCDHFVKKSNSNEIYMTYFHIVTSYVTVLCLHLRVQAMHDDCHFCDLKKLLVKCCTFLVPQEPHSTPTHCW